MTAPRYRPPALLLLLVLAACGEQAEPPGASPMRLEVVPAPAARPQAAPLPTEDAWGWNSNPWRRFAPGSWVEFELPGGVRERQMLEQVAGGRVQLAIQVRHPGDPDWEKKGLLRRVEPAGSWLLARRLRKGSTEKQVVVELAGHRLSVQEIRSGNLVLLLSSQVPGAVVLIRELLPHAKGGGGGDKGAEGDTQRKLAAFGGTPAPGGAPAEAGSAAKEVPPKKN